MQLKKKSTLRNYFPNKYSNLFTVASLMMRLSKITKNHFNISLLASRLIQQKNTENVKRRSKRRKKSFSDSAHETRAFFPLLLSTNTTANRRI
jgi:hypothetical protein